MGVGFSVGTYLERDGRHRKNRVKRGRIDCPTFVPSACRPNAGPGLKPRGLSIQLVRYVYAPIISNLHVHHGAEAHKS